MSQKPVSSVVEWSPSTVSWIDEHHVCRTSDSLRDLAGSLASRDITVAVSRRTAFVRAIRVPNASKADLRRILQVQLGQLFPIPANELAFDFHITSDLNSEGRLVVVAAMRASDLESIHSQAKVGGLRIVRIAPSSLSSALLAKSLQKDNAAVVHRTAEGLSVDLIVDGELRYSRVASMPATALAIESEVSRTFAAAVLSCSPTIAAGALAVPDAEVSTDTWAIELLASAHLDINIESAAQIETRDRKGQLSRLRVAIVLFGAACAFCAWQALRYTDSGKKASAYLTQSSKSIASSKMALDSELAKKSKNDTINTLLDRAFQPPQSLGDIVTLATNAVPKGVWLTGFSIDRGKSLTLRGTSTNGSAISDFQDALINEADGDQSRFRDVKRDFSNNAEVEKTPVVQFSISAFPVGNLPLVDLAAKQKGGSKP